MSDDLIKHELSEADEQAAIVEYFRTKYPQHVRALRISANGIHRGKGLVAQRRIRREKRLGFQTGESDIIIALKRGEFGSLHIEHKCAAGRGKATEDQLEYIKYHNSVGNCAIVTQGIDAAIAAIDQYMALK